MNKNVLVALADKNYINQAKQLFSSAYWNAGWRGDYLLLGYEMDRKDYEWFRQKGIIVRRCESLLDNNEKRGDRITASKCYLFSEEFKQWDHVVYFDVDILIRAPIDRLAEVDGFAACHSMWQTLKDNFIDIQLIDPDLVNEIRITYDLRREAFNSGVLAFSTNIIENNTFTKLVEHFKKYVSVGLFGGDQLPLNLYFYNRWEKLAPVYNRIVQVNDTFSFDQKLINAIIIHVVGFGDGPWNPSNAFHKEWSINFNKSEVLDLSNIPFRKPWSKEEIENVSRIIIKQQALHGEKFILSNLPKLIEKGFKLFRNDFRGGLNKVKGICKSLLGHI